MRRGGPHVVTAAFVVLTAVLAWWNAREYPPLGGYDAAEHVAYARQLLESGSLPTAEEGASYTPPGFYAVAAAAMKLREALGVAEPERMVLYVNAFLAVGTALLLLWLARILFPGRIVLHWGALAFFLACPLVLRSFAMFHPQPLAVFLSTLALALTARMIVGRRYRWIDWLALAVVLAGAQLVRSISLVTVGVVLLALVGTAALDPLSRRRIRSALLVFVAVLVLVPLPWYLHLQATTSSPIFGRGEITSSLLDSPWPASFYIDPGLPAAITHPHRHVLAPLLLATLYADTWGDYFGNWSWGGPRPELAPTEWRLSLQSAVGLPLTALALSGWIALATLLVRGRRHPARLLPVLLPAAAVLAVAFYARQAPHPDGDTIKALFLLPAAPAWALAFGFALDVIARRETRVAAAVAAVVGVCAAVSLTYGVFATVS